jgi:hypothetical protein
MAGIAVIPARINPRAVSGFPGSIWQWRRGFCYATRGEFAIAGRAVLLAAMLASDL